MISHHFTRKILHVLYHSVYQAESAPGYHGTGPGRLLAAGPLNFVISDKHYRLLADQPYGENERQKVDVYFPLENLEQAPVWWCSITAGSWRGGERGNYAFVGEALAAHGMIGVIADYRVYPEITYPDFMHDSAAAVAWVEKERQQWQKEPQPLFVMGHSAGAYNAAMLALDDRWLGAEGFEQGYSQRLDRPFWPLRLYPDHQSAGKTGIPPS